MAPAMLLGEDRMGISQDKFAGALFTPLGEDVLCLTGFTVDEALGEPYKMDVEAVSEQANIDFDKLLGRVCGMRLSLSEDKIRWFYGHLTAAQSVGSEAGGLSRYRLVLRPWFWLLNYRVDCRIFHKKTVKEIIEKVFTDAGFSKGTDFKLNMLKEVYEQIEYCVQYRESDFAFVSRLMEQYGIYYYFEHRENPPQLMMVLADAPASHKPIEDLSKVRFSPQLKGDSRGEQIISSWISERRFCTGKVELKDYNYLKPNEQMGADNERFGKYTEARLGAIYDYPGKYDKQSEGQKFAQFRREAEQALDHRRKAGGYAPCLFPGGLVTLQDHPNSAENEKYLVVRCTHDYSGQSYRSGGETGIYHGSYELQRSNQQFRSLPLTPKPRIQGIQTAKVVAKDKGDENAHEEISTDKDGHIWVQFHWDRGNPNAKEQEDREPKKSCPIRVAQPWAGNGWGHQFIPRIGMEVVVEFLEGDPDRPLVIGCVYNGVNRPMAQLPETKNSSGLRTDSTKGHNGYNMLAFDDTKGDETIWVRAEKLLQVEVMNEEKRVVHKDRNTWVQGNDKEYVKGVREVHVTQVSKTQGNQAVWIHSHGEVSSGVGPGDTSTSSVRLFTDGINLKAPASIELDAGAIRIVGSVTIAGSLTVLGPVVAAAAVVGGRPV